MDLLSDLVKPALTGDKAIRFVCAGEASGAGEVGEALEERASRELVQTQELLPLPALTSKFLNRTLLGDKGGAEFKFRASSRNPL